MGKNRVFHLSLCLLVFCLVMVSTIQSARSEKSLEEQMKASQLRDLNTASQAAHDEQQAHEKNPTSLRDAIQKNDLVALRTLIQQGHNVNEADQNQQTPLDVAVLSSPEAVSLLLDNGANPNALDNENSTPLLRAITKSDFGNDAKVLPIVKVLIDHGADVNITDLYNNSPLQCAYRQAMLDVVYVLLEKNARPNLRTTQYNSDTILHMVAQQSPKQFMDPFGMRVIGQPIERATLWPHSLKNQCAFAALLIEKGADVNAIDANNKRTPLIEALSNKNYPLVELLLTKGATLWTHDGLSENPVDVAIRLKDRDLLSYVFSKGGQPTTAKESGLSSLVAAVQTEDTSLVDLLLQHGANINEKSSPTYGERTPLFFSLLPHNLKMITYLVEHGADIKIISGFGTTPLYEAIEKKLDSDIIAYLIDKGSDINFKRTQFGSLSVLEQACKLGSQETVQLLVQRGAHVPPGQKACDGS